MGAFGYGVEAALFSAKGTHFRPKSLEYRRLKYRRFVRVAVAIRFAIEDLPSNTLVWAKIEMLATRSLSSMKARIFRCRGARNVPRSAQGNLLAFMRSRTTGDFA
jgi:hypothetical protein